MLKNNLKVFCYSTFVILMLSSCASTPLIKTSYNVKELNLNQYSNSNDYHYLMAFTYFYNNNLKDGIKEYELFLKDNPQRFFSLRISV